MKCRNCGAVLPRGAWETVCPQCGRRYPPLWRVFVGLGILVFGVVLTVLLDLAARQHTITEIMSTVLFFAFAAFYAVYVVWLYKRRRSSTITQEDFIPKPAIVGGLLVVCGISLMFTGVLFFRWMDLLGLTNPRPPLLESCANLEYIFGFVALVAAFFSFRQRHYGLVRAATVLSIIGIGGGFSLILGIVALTLLLKSEEDFQD